MKSRPGSASSNIMFEVLVEVLVAELFRVEQSPQTFGSLLLTFPRTRTELATLICCPITVTSLNRVNFNWKFLPRSIPFYG